MSAQRVAVFGGVYSNHLALNALLRDTEERGIENRFCLGDIGAFGPNPDKACDLLRNAGVFVIQGNYDNSIGNGLADCQCGYTDPQDNYFARLSYDYTFRHTSEHHKAWMRLLPTEHRFHLGDLKVLLCHGSPRKTNEFLWETTTSNAFLRKLFETYDTDVIVATHTGLEWHREVAPGKHFVNCGVIGRPPNNGDTRVVYTILECRDDGGLGVEFVNLEYDYLKLAEEMRTERLPEEFVETVLTGWWTTCLEILPSKERARGRF